MNKPPISEEEEGDLQDTEGTHHLANPATTQELTSSDNNVAGAANSSSSVRAKQGGQASKTIYNLMQELVEEKQQKSGKVKASAKE